MKIGFAYTACFYEHFKRHLTFDDLISVKMHSLGYCAIFYLICSVTFFVRFLWYVCFDC